MAGRSKRSSSSLSESEKKLDKRQVTVNTFGKWQGQYNTSYETLTWLRCDKDTSDRGVVSSLYCDICRKYESRIKAQKNFSLAWIKGTTNHRTSSIIDHAKSVQHKAAMAYFKADQARASDEPVTSFSPIARCLMQMDETAKNRTMRKFDICYVMAKEGIAFAKYTALYNLEERHDVDLGIAYKNDVSAKSFTHFIAESQRNDFLRSFSSSPFFSFLIDGTTDSGNVEDELIIVLYCKRDDIAKEIKVCARYLSVTTPDKADTEGLVKCVKDAMTRLRIDDVLDREVVLSSKPILIGGGSDGASVNIGQHHSMKAKMQEGLDWLFWSWCFAHCLELASKDGLQSSLFREVEEMLLRLYYLYKKSPKKTRELESIVEELKEVYEFSGSGNKPIRSQGSRWIDHKRRALQRVTDRYGAFISHLIALSEDASLKSEDRARMKGFAQKWSHGKYVVACAMYTDVLKPPSALSLSLQGSEVDIVYGIKQLLKASTTMVSMLEQDPLEWSTVKLVLDRVQNDGDGEQVYQGVSLKRYDATMLSYCSKQAQSDLRRLTEKMRERLEWSDTELLRALLVFVETQSWAERGDGQTDSSLVELKTAVELIVAQFRAPLEAAGVDLFRLQDEIEDAVEYARKYLNLESSKYRKVWYNLHICPAASSWPNLLLLCQLVFSLPFSNGRVEQIFSSLKIIKTANRTSMSVSTLDDLLEIFVEGPPLDKFSADSAVELWWTSCTTTRRVNQTPRKSYRPRASNESTSCTTESEEIPLALDEWDTLFGTTAEPGTDESDDSYGDSDIEYDI